ncbi:hypothetical protein KFK09_024668 [Dendrobium nobile]|uniref:Uncharacterized protein n=1 Tax=Dendrobium nobile TaxID=94219 RepID=A0A8T3AED7_DENNO|nr:hypothetical protein KFK09_024668 [Dendrobium nobile]
MSSGLLLKSNTPLQRSKPIFCLSQLQRDHKIWLACSARAPSSRQALLLTAALHLAPHELQGSPILCDLDCKTSKSWHLATAEVTSDFRLPTNPHVPMRLARNSTNVDPSPHLYASSDLGLAKNLLL